MQAETERIYQFFDRFLNKGDGKGQRSAKNHDAFRLAIPAISPFPTILRGHLFLFFSESGLDFARMRVYIQAIKQQAHHF